MRIATIGTGVIVEQFLQAIDQLDGASCHAVYSRKEATAKTLADQFGVEHTYTDLSEMLKNPNIDAVYIASPNSLHSEHATAALKNGKHVICEKPFTSNVKELEALIALAKEQKLLLFEAITTVHMPNYHLIKKHLHQLGRIKLVQCNYSQYSSKYNRLLAGETPNVFNPAFSGGALMDINIYNVHFIMNLFGTPEQVHYLANRHPNGIDTSGVLTFHYHDFIATSVGSKDTSSMNFALIQGEKGFIHVKNGANGCEEVLLHIGDQVTSLNAQTNANRLFYEVEAFQHIIETKDHDTCYAWLDESRSVMNVLEAARKDAGIVFPADHA
ncbi:Gfo/Idh/MocA family protein [Bacillus sp. 179-C3.3 HS]|uniref:Gfo/Idh/MocA family protein n=1 Tax=Bacillus sp. 179-C3.3 HS TaxID=3232162 RepID=UPI0039A36B52